MVSTLDISKCSRVLKWHHADSELVGVQHIENKTKTFCVGSTFRSIAWEADYSPERKLLPTIGHVLAGRKVLLDK